jgi:hypothetical protein
MTHRPLATISSCIGMLSAVVLLSAQTTDAIDAALRTGQMDLATSGKPFLVQAASRSLFTAIGGLHGDNETSVLVQDLYGALAPSGYRFIAVEMSPWAAGRLAVGPSKESMANLWGSDIEEVQPQLVIRDLALANPQNVALQAMVDLVKDGYRRASAPRLLALARQVGEITDVEAGGISLQRLMVTTLQVEATRHDVGAFAASVEREAAMKELFLSHYRAVTPGQAKPKVLLVFGQNHLHRGIDRRGVSTLGNFIAELAAAEGGDSFHVALFAAGGKILVGGLQDADQRKDDPAFEFLASLARYPVTVFDLRPVRATLHAINTLTARNAGLLYWADSYDAIVCYREVTPMTIPGR